jgi:glutaconate CoA-transferase, subunit B
MSAAPYETHELMICRIAAEMTAQEECVTVLGSFTPLAYAAYMLGKLTHARDAWLVAYNAVGILPVELSFTGAEAAVYRGSLARLAFIENGHLVHLHRRGLIECVSSAQMDGEGAINLSVIGDHTRPAVRLPGGAGAPEVMQNFRKVIVYFSRHDTRTLVPKVDFVTGRRRPIDPGAREAEGLAGGSPVLVVTPLAVMVKEHDERPFRLQSVHPGVSVQEVIESTGFELEVPEELPSTAIPTDEQLALLRDRIDPFGTVKFDFLSGEQRLAYLEEILAKEWERAAAGLGA